MATIVKERIISADSHVSIRDEAVLGHLDTKHHEAYQQARAEQMAIRAKKAKPKATQLPVGQVNAPWKAAGRPGEHDPSERLKDMDIDGVEAEVLYTNIDGGSTFYGIKDGGRLAAFQAFNNASFDFSAADPKRLLVVYIVPLADMDEAVKEVHRLAGQGARAIMLPPYPTDLGLLPYFDSHYDRLWGAIQETGIPISQHVGANAACWNIMDYDTTGAKGIFQSLPPIMMAEVLANWIVGGVFVRFPKLKVVMVESGLGWIPYYLERLDTMQGRHGWSNYDMIKEKPSTYWHQNMMATFEEDTFGVANRDVLGVGNLMWATDYPHPDCTWPESQKVLDTHFSDIPPDEARQIVGGNAARVYHL